MKRLIAIVMLAICGVSSAQTAKVISLNAKDAAEAKSLHDQQAALTGKVSTFHDHIVTAYLMVATKPQAPICVSGNFSQCAQYLSGWGSGEFLFSEDYKYIVPNPALPQSSGNLWNNGSCITLTNASGNYAPQ